MTHRIDKDETLHALRVSDTLIVPERPVIGHKRGISWNPITKRLSVSDGSEWSDVVYRQEVVQDQFDAVVDASGAEDYTLISAALTDGKRSIRRGRLCIYG